MKSLLLLKNTVYPLQLRRPLVAAVADETSAGTANGAAARDSSEAKSSTRRRHRDVRATRVLQGSETFLRKPSTERPARKDIAHSRCPRLTLSSVRL